MQNAPSRTSTASGRMKKYFCRVMNPLKVYRGLRGCRIGAVRAVKLCDFYERYFYLKMTRAD